MSIGKRLVVMLAVALVALLAVGGIGLKAFVSLNNQVQSLTVESIPRVQATNDIAIAYREMRALLLSHIMEEDVDLKKAFNQKVDEAVGKAKLAVDGYASFASDATDKANYGAMKTAFDTYQSGYAEALKSSNAAQADQAVAALYGKVIPAEQVLQASIEKMAGYNIKMQEAAALEAESVYESSRNLFMVVIALGVLVLVGFGWWIYGAVSGPLALMERTVERIGRDLDFTQRVPISSRDEVGMTVAAFNRLLDTLQTSFRDIASGVDGVAGQATIERLTPVAFGLIYSLSGAVGPVLAQNLGAKRYDRVREGLRASLWFMVVSVAAAWLILALVQGPLIRAFSLDGVAAAMVHAFCSWIAASFFFMGALFVANAAFNNLGRPLWSTGFNWGRATLGTIPFAWWGAKYGPVEVLAGQAAGAAIFGTLALVCAFWLTKTLEHSR